MEGPPPSLLELRHLTDLLVRCLVAHILLKNSGSSADVSESQKCWRGEAPQIVFRRTQSKATHSPRRCRLEKLPEILRTEFFNTIGRFRPIALQHGFTVHRTAGPDPLRRVGHGQPLIFAPLKKRRICYLTSCSTPPMLPITLRGNRNSQ